MKRPSTKWLPLFAVIAFAIAFTSRSAHAQETFSYGFPYNPGTAANNQRCTKILAELIQADLAIEFVGWAGATIWNASASNGGCNTDLVDAPANSVVVKYTLWKVDELNAGHTPTVCQSANQWYEFLDTSWWVAAITSPTIGGVTADNYTQGCGSGYYNLGVDGYVLINGVWEGGTSFSGWQYMTLSDGPVIPPK